MYPLGIKHNLQLGQKTTITPTAALESFPGCFIYCPALTRSRFYSGGVGDFVIPPLSLQGGDGWANAAYVGHNNGFLLSKPWCSTLRLSFEDYM